MTVSGFELGTDGPRVIVVGVDGSEGSLRAAAYAMGVARRHDAELIAVKVEAEVPAAAISAATAAPALLPAVYDSQNDGQNWLLDQLKTDARAWSAHFEMVVRHGDAAGQLADVAQQSRADMVVVGAATSLAHRLLGSLPQRLSRRRQWVLTIVP